MNTMDLTAQFGDTRLAEWFWSQVQVADSGCWEWTGPLSNGGYGYPYLPDLRRREYTHRLSYEAFVAPLHPDLVIDHLCRNRPCCDPAHLEQVPQRENIMRSPIAIASINASKTHCIRGHEFTPENTGQATSGGRRCKTCVAEGEQERRQDPAYVERRRTVIRESQRRYVARKQAAGAR